MFQGRKNKCLYSVIEVPAHSEPLKYPVRNSVYRAVRDLQRAGISSILVLKVFPSVHAKSLC